MEHVERQPGNEPILPTRQIPEHPRLWALLRLWYGIIRMRFVREAPESVHYETSLRLIDRPLLQLLAEFGALSAASLTELVNRRQIIDTRPARTGIHEMTTDTARDWLTSAWRRGLAITMPEPPPGCSLETPLWALTQDGRARLRNPVVSAISRFPWLGLLSILVAAGGVIYTWINQHANVALVISIWVVIAAVYALGLWLLVRLLEAKEAPIGLVAIETHRARETLPPLLGTIAA
jgi:hypothetical protein